MMLYIRRLILRTSLLEQYRRHFEDERHILLILLLLHIHYNCLQLNIKSSHDVMILIILANPVDEIQPVRMQQEKRCVLRFGVCFRNKDILYTVSTDPNYSNYNCDASILSYVLKTLKRMQLTAIGTKPCPVPIARRNSSRINSEPLYLVLST